MYGIEKVLFQFARPTRQKHDLDKLLAVITDIDSSLTSGLIKDFHRLGKYKRNSPYPCPLIQVKCELGLLRFQSFNLAEVPCPLQSLLSNLITSCKIENVPLKNTHAT